MHKQKGGIAEYELIFLSIWTDQEPEVNRAGACKSCSWHSQLKGDYEELSRALGHWHYCKCVKWLASLKPKLIDYAPTDASSSLPQSGCCWSWASSQGVSSSALAALLWPIINSGGMQVLPVNGSGSFQQMVSERGNSLSPHRSAVLIVLCLAAHKNRIVTCLLIELKCC